MQTASRQAGGHNESTNKSQHTQESVYHIEAQLIPDNIRNHSPSSHNVADTNINVKKSLFPGNDKPSHQLNPLEELKFALSSISEDDSSKILPLIMKLIEYYHIHIKRLKDLVRSKQADIGQLQSSVVPGLQASLQASRSELEATRQAERDLIGRLESCKYQVLEREKEISRLRGLVEEEKARVFQKRRVEQDWIDDTDKLRREIVGLRELGALKDEEITYLKKNLRGLEEEAIELRDQKRELNGKVEKLQMQPFTDEKNQIEKSSKYLVEQINSLKRELYKAKSVVENYKNDRESERNERNESANRFNNRREPDESHHEVKDRRGQSPPQQKPARTEQRLNQSWHDEPKNSRYSTPGKEEVNNYRRRYSTETAEVRERSSSPVDRRSGSLRRGGRIERRHEMKLDDNHNASLTLPSTTKDPFSDQSLIYDPNLRRDPNQGSGNIIAGKYPEEWRKGQHKDKWKTGSIDSPHKQKLRAEIGHYYCNLNRNQR